MDYEADGTPLIHHCTTDHIHNRIRRLA
jgi:hypothetical protein